MTPRQDAVASLAEDVGRALVAFAQRLRDEDTSPPPVAPGATHGRQLGKSQQRVLNAVTTAGDRGLTAAEVGSHTGISSTNTPRILKALADRGLVTSTDETPAIWRAAVSDD